jgi:hypothetical protein
MTSTDKRFDKIAECYKETLKAFLTENHIKRVDFIKGNFSKRYTHLIVNNNDIYLYVKGLRCPVNNFLFDFTLDYAYLLAQLEDDLFYVERNSMPQNGFNVKFTFTEDK